MSRNLLTVEQAKREIRLLLGPQESSVGDEEADAFDDLIEELIPEVSEIVIGYLKGAADEFLDSDGNVVVDSDGAPDIPRDVRAAARLLFRIMFEHTDETQAQLYAGGNLPEGVMAILRIRRVPTLA